MSLPDTPRMTRSLADAIASTDAGERRRLVQALGEGGVTDRALGRLLLGLRSELLAEDNREMAALAGLKADAQAERDAVYRRVYGEDPIADGGARWSEQGRDDDTPSG